MTGHRYPDTRYAWFMVILLTLAYILSFIDRSILGLLVEPIKTDLNLTDTQIGLLMGPAFGVVYATMGLPIGWLADRKRRTFIVAAGIALWSIATAVTGFAKNFIHIFAARMGVGIGEAALSPCAMSMISDSFEPARRGKPIAFYTAALSLGGGIASLVAAGVLNWAKTVPAVELPLIGALAPWQLIFIIVGMPGVLLSVVFLFLREPPRTERDQNNSDAQMSFTQMLAYVYRHFNAYFGIIAMVGAMVIVAYSHGWLAPTFKRTWGWEAEEYALVNGLIMLIAGPITVNFAGWLSDKLYAGGRRDAPYLIILTGLLILVPSGIVALLMPTPTLAFVLLTVNLIGMVFASAVGPTAILNITPENIRAQVIALYYMIISLAGLILGPMTVGLLSDYVFGEAGLRYAVAAIPALFGIPVLIYGFCVKQSYLDKLEKQP